MTKPFDRGLTDEFVEALNRAYEDPSSWWRKLVDDKDLFLGIRENYINVYYNGGSILELEHRNGTGLVGRTHFKYLVNLSREDNTKDYVNFTGGNFDSVTISDSYTSITAHLSQIKRAAKSYQGDEKTGVHEISIKRNNVVDVEIQFPGTGSRIDFAALQRAKSGIEIVFYEAKTYSNKELRSRSGNPAVVEQVKRYESMLMDRREDIESSYQNVAKNICKITGWGCKRNSIVSEAAKGNITLNPEVRLVVFGYDTPQRTAAACPRGIFTKLKGLLDSRPVITAGAAANVTLR